MTDREKALQCVCGMIESICDRVIEGEDYKYLRARALGIVWAYECVGLITEIEGAAFEGQVYDEEDKGRKLLRAIKRRERNRMEETG